jgi:hypothetical protein
MLRPSAALSATAGSWVSELAPVTATTAVAVVVSILSRNGWVGVLGPVVAVVGIDLLSMLSSLDPIRPLLWTSGFEAWHGLPRSGVYLGEIRDSLEASAVWTALLLATAAWVFVRRDVVEP